MACRDDVKPWTEADERYILQNRGKLTNGMMAEDLGRTKDAVETRLRRLKAMGYSLQNLPSGPRTNQPKPKPKTPDVFTHAEREAMRDEVQTYLTHQVVTSKLSIERATEISKAIKENVLQAPEWRFKRYAQKSVQTVVANFL